MYIPKIFKRYIFEEIFITEKINNVKLVIYDLLVGLNDEGISGAIYAFKLKKLFLIERLSCTNEDGKQK